MNAKIDSSKKEPLIKEQIINILGAVEIDPRKSSLGFVRRFFKTENKENCK